jgi:hypothetical protein
VPAGGTVSAEVRPVRPGRHLPGDPEEMEGRTGSTSTRCGETSVRP